MAFTAGFASCRVHYVQLLHATCALHTGWIRCLLHSTILCFRHDLCIPFCKLGPITIFFISRWFNFEKVIEALVADNVYHTNTVHLQTYAKDVCFIEDDGQFHTMLNFYHDLGMIVKHRSTVILKAQWLINLFKKLITIPAFKKAVG